MKKKAETRHFHTIQQLHTIPLEKVASFCEDLRLWLSVCRAAEIQGFAMSAKTDVFRWIDDGKHDVRINVTIHQPVESATPQNAEAPKVEESRTVGAQNLSSSMFAPPLETHDDEVARG